MTNTLNTNDIIDVRDIIEQYETLETDIETLRESEQMSDQHAADEAAAELAQLTALLEDLKGQGGDEQWGGDWYPVTLVRDSYFKTYAQELAEECGMIDEKAQWPNTCIDWGQAARELQHDYTPCEIDGVIYWYR